MKYLRKFVDRTAYTTERNEDSLVIPNISLIDSENKIEFEFSLSRYKSRYLTIESLEDSNTISWKTNNSSLTKTISVSTDNGSTWTSKTSSTSGVTLATLNAGEKLLIKGNNSAYATSSHYNYFVSTKEFNVTGNIISLINSDNFINQTTLSSTYALKHLFYNCAKLKSAEHLVLPATTLTNHCYRQMFQNCTALTTAPEELPATTLASYCYSNMFSGCTSLETTPELPATTLASYCYESMFQNCTSLETAPELPATTLATYCYMGMFSGCTALMSAPELPATTLTGYCYSSMFSGCTALTSAPELPATILASSCYFRIFYGCVNLSSITCLATNISASGCTTYWVSSVSVSGTFTKAASMTDWTIGNNGIPSGWTTLNATS